MRQKIHGLFTVLVIFLACSMIGTLPRDTRAESQEPRGTIEVRITGFANDNGQACASLFNSPEGYPTQPEKASHRGCAPIADRQATILFADLPYGSYAAFAFHDRDSNNQILKSRIGIPREPMGASNNARGRFGPPSFEDAAFRHDAPRTVAPIAVREL